jgi:PAS domain S-box-containing protein
MTKKPTPGYSVLRKRAEEKPCAGDAEASEVLIHLESQKLLHELEIQNDELSRLLAKKSENEEHLRNIIGMTPAGYFHLDLEDRFVDVNDAWLKMFGYDSLDEVIGKHFSILPADNESDSVQKLLAELHRGIPITLGEFSSRRKDGTVGHNIFFAHPTFQTVRIIGFEWFAIDVSERRRVEEEKLEFERQKQLAQKLESLGILAGGIAHDFNNILSIIIGNCSLALKRPDMVGELIPEIGIAAVRASDLCRQMLAYAGKSSYKMQKVRLTTLLDDLIKIMKATIKQNTVITSNYSDDMPVIMGDASQINQIVMNLILNASESIGEADGEIRVSLSKKVITAGQSEKDNLGMLITPGCYVCLEITDNGCGMDTETRFRIFEPFYTTKLKARGLGMSAVLGIIRSHKGALQLFSQPGLGSTFKVYLPFLNVASTVADSPRQATRMLWQGRGTILLVEDEVQLITVAKTLLNTMGFTVFEALNGIEALELYKMHAAEITLVLTDIGMPLMDGYELCRELKKINPELPIIVTSGFAESDVASHIAKGDIVGIVSKPYNYDQLWEMLRGVLDSELAKQV